MEADISLDKSSHPTIDESFKNVLICTSFHNITDMQSSNHVICMIFGAFYLP